MMIVYKPFFLLLEEKIPWTLKRFYQRYVFGTPKRFYTEPFLRVE